MAVKVGHRIVVVVGRNVVIARVVIGFNYFCKFGLAFWTDQSVFVPIPLVLAMVTEHHLSLILSVHDR